MTTATPTPTGTPTKEPLERGGKRSIEVLDRKASEADERMRLPRQPSAVVEGASQNKQESILDMIAKTIAAFHDWLAGPPTSAQHRVEQDIVEHGNWGHYGLMGGV